MTRTTAARPTGTPAYGASRDLPWNVMGGHLTVTDAPVAAVLAQSGLDYRVRMTDAAADLTSETVPLDGDDQPAYLGADRFRAIVRDLPGKRGLVLGFTGKRYAPIQNDEAFAVADVLRDEHGASISGAADFRGGGASLLTINLGAPVQLIRPDGLVDYVDLHLLIKNAHDGQGALTFALTGMRIACTNAVQASIAGAERVWKMSHTPNAKQRMELAHQAIVNAQTYRPAFQAAAQAMLDQPMVDAEFAKIVDRLFHADADDTKVAAERRRETQRQLIDLYRTSPTLEGVRGTRWGGYNALTEWSDHFRPVRTEATGAVMRAEGALEGAPVRFKGQVWDLFAKV